MVSTLAIGRAVRQQPLGWVKASKCRTAPRDYAGEIFCKQRVNNKMCFGFAQTTLSPSQRTRSQSKVPRKKKKFCKLIYLQSHFECEDGVGHVNSVVRVNRRRRNAEKILLVFAPPLWTWRALSCYLWKISWWNVCLSPPARLTPHTTKCSRTMMMMLYIFLIFCCTNKKSLFIVIRINYLFNSRGKKFKRL